MKRRTQDSELVAYVQRELRAAANPSKAVPMAAYMKTDMPFYGAQKTQRAVIAREFRKRFPPSTQADYSRNVKSLWKLKHREEKYLAITYARSFDAFVSTSSLKLYQELIAQGAWWDFVDEVAIHLVGRVLMRERAKTQAIIDKWIDAKSMWLRRTAIIAQVAHKGETDERRLFRYCLQRSHEQEFFIRKAIGWALREYSKTAPTEVARFVRANQASLSVLSVREATRRLPAQTWPPSS